MDGLLCCAGVFDLKDASLTFGLPLGYARTPLVFANNTPVEALRMTIWHFPRLD